MAFLHHIPVQPPRQSSDARCRAFQRVSLALFSVDRVKEAAARRGLQIVDRHAGPWISFEVYAADARVGYITGYKVPSTARVHIDGLRTARTESRRGALHAATAGKLLVLSLLAHAWQRGAKQVYGLAIDDAQEQHRRLVRYFERLGARVVRRVDGSLRDVPDRLVWGGVGTLMCADVTTLLGRFSNLLDSGEHAVSHSNSESDLA